MESVDKARACGPGEAVVEQWVSSTSSLSAGAAWGDGEGADAGASRGCQPSDGCCGAKGQCGEARGGGCGDGDVADCECECWKCGVRYPCSFEMVDKLYLDRPFQAAGVFLEREGEGSNMATTPRKEEDCEFIPALRCGQSCGDCTQGEDNEETIVALYFEEAWVPLPKFMLDPEGRDGIHEVEKGFNRDRITLQILNRMLFVTEEDRTIAKEAAQAQLAAPDLGGEKSTFNTVPSGMGAAIYWVGGVAAGFYTYALADNETFIDRFWPVPALCCCAVRPSFRRRGLGAQMVAHFYRRKFPDVSGGVDLADTALPVAFKAGIHLPVSNPMLHTMRKTLSPRELKNIMMLEVLPEGQRKNHSGCTVDDLEKCGRSVGGHIEKAEGGKLRRKSSDVVLKSKRALQRYRHPKPLKADDSICGIM